MLACPPVYIMLLANLDSFRSLAVNTIILITLTRIAYKSVPAPFTLGYLTTSGLPSLPAGRVALALRIQSLNDHCSTPLGAKDCYKT